MSGLTIGAGIDLDLGGMTVTGSGVNYGVTMSAGGTVRNGTVEGFEQGLVIFGGDAATWTVTTVLVRSNEADGIRVEITNPAARVVVGGATAVELNRGDGIVVRGAPG